MCGCDCIGQSWNKKPCYELIEKKFGREYADQLLVNHPAKILTGEMK